jgi:nicotinamidase-related amidase
MIEILGRQVPTELPELVDPRQSAFAIVDMQNDFCSEGGSAYQEGADLSTYSKIVPRIAQLAQACRVVGVPVIHVRMIALPGGGSDSVSWIRLRLRAGKNLGEPKESNHVWDFTVDGTWGAEFISELTPQSDDLVVTKFRSSAFFNTSLDTILRSRKVQTLMVAGCTTEGCVESTVRDASFYDYIPVVVSDCVGSDDPRLHDASMTVMSAYRADIATSTEIVQCWTEQGSAR